MVPSFWIIRMEAGGKEAIDAVNRIGLGLRVDLKKLVVIGNFHNLPAESRILKQSQNAATRFAAGDLVAGSIPRSPAGRCGAVYGIEILHAQKSGCRCSRTTAEGLGMVSE